jgi:glycosyltransferase involved in cell wall biosynthesis
VLYLLEHPEEAARMSARGRAFVERHRDYKVIAAAVEQTYHALLHRQSANPMSILQQPS